MESRFRLCTNSSAEEKRRISNPIEGSRLERASRTDSSSSTTATTVLPPINQKKVGRTGRRRQYTYVLQIFFNDPEADGILDQLGHRAGSHFLHDPSAMHLDGDLARP